MTMFTGRSFKLFRGHPVIIFAFDHLSFVIIPKRFINNTLRFFNFTYAAQMSEICVDRFWNHLHGFHVVAFMPGQTIIPAILRDNFRSPFLSITAICSPLFRGKRIRLFKVAGFIIFHMQISHRALIRMMRF